MNDLTSHHYTPLLLHFAQQFPTQQATSEGLVGPEM